DFPVRLLKGLDDFVFLHIVAPADNRVRIAADGMPEAYFGRVGESIERLPGGVDKGVLRGVPDSGLGSLACGELPDEPPRDVAENGVLAEAFAPGLQGPDALRQVERVEPLLLRGEHLPGGIHIGLERLDFLRKGFLRLRRDGLDGLAVRREPLYS